MVTSRLPSGSSIMVLPRMFVKLSTMASLRYAQHEKKAILKYTCGLYSMVLRTTFGPATLTKQSLANPLKMENSHQTSFAVPWKIFLPTTPISSLSFFLPCVACPVCPSQHLPMGARTKLCAPPMAHVTYQSSVAWKAASLRTFLTLWGWCGAATSEIFVKPMQALAERIFG